jgi:chemotaxis protein MotA
MKIVVGNIILFLGIFVSIVHLEQGLTSYWDFVAFFVVIFGTFAVSLMTSPAMRTRIILRQLFSSFQNPAAKRESAINNAVSVLKGQKFNSTINSRIDERILADGLELVKLGFSSEKIKLILEQRIEKSADDHMMIANWFRGLAKYPPAFGLVGTVLGLIHLMRGLAEGSDPKETGIRMAIALVATLYGLILSNAFINPIGERIRNNILEEINLCEISVQSVLMLKDQTNLLEAQEFLSSYLATGAQKLNLLGENVGAL